MAGWEDRPPYIGFIIVIGRRGDDSDVFVRTSTNYCESDDCF